MGCWSGPRLAQGGHKTICGHALVGLFLFFLGCDFASAQQGFLLKTLTNDSIVCGGNSTLTPDVPGLPQAACLTPFPCISQNYSVAIAGTCSYKDPILLSPSLSFNTMFSFNTLEFPTFRPGEGFTFFMSPSKPDSSGEAGGYLGWLNPTTNGDQSGHNFAVEFDLVNETTGGFDDPPYDHVGVNVNSLISNITYNVKDSHLATLSSSAHLYAWIDYDGANKWIDVRLNQDNRKPCKPIISQFLDLTDVLQQTMYVGFSSSTGGNNINTSYNTQTSVFDWSFNTLGQAVNIFDDDEKCGLQVSTTTILGIIIAVLGLAVILMFSVVLLFYMRTKKVSNLEREKAELVAELKQLDFGAREFSYQEISEATGGFKEEIGAGGFGIVYKGNLSNLSSHKKRFTMVAVKKINQTSKSADDAKQLVAEVKVIGRLIHRNILPVLGWCYEREQMLLVYEYMENGDLDQHLFPSDDGINGDKLFSWEQRIRILRGVADALKFLHEDFESEQTVLHRDIKTQNVMIDGNFNARLGDFGLARFCDRSSEGHQSQQLVGTRGYIAPEYLAMGATVETDVYSFGVMMLVVTTGRKPIDKTIPQPGFLVDWVRRLYDEGRIRDAGDVKLMSNDSNLQEMERVLILGLFCCLFGPRDRPSMRDVVAALRGTPPIFSWPMPQKSYPLHESTFDLDFPGMDDEDITIPFDEYKTDELPFYTAKQSSFAKFNID